jgi:hypothetical protein
VNNYIEAIIQEKGNVIVPGLGSFGINKTTGKPLFNEFLKFDDGVLKKHVVEKEGISPEEALAKIEDHVASIKSALDQSSKYPLGGIGVLIKDEKGKVMISSEEGAASTPKAATPTPVPTPETKPTPKPEVKKEEIPTTPPVEKPKKEEKKEEVKKEEKTPEKAPESKPEVKPEIKVEVKVEKDPEPKKESVEEKPTEKKEPAPVKDTPKDKAPEKKEKKKKKKKFPLWLIILLVIILLLGGGVAWQWNLVNNFVSGLLNKSSKEVELVEEQLEESTSEEDADELSDNQEETEGQDTTVDTEEKVVSSPVPAPKTSTPSGSAFPGGSYHVIVGCFQYETLADRLVDQLRQDGFSGATRAGQVRGLNAVSAGSYPSYDQAKQQANSLDGRFKGAWVLKR